MFSNKSYISPVNIKYLIEDNDISLFEGDNFGSLLFYPGMRIKNKELLDRFENVNINFDLAKFSNWPIVIDEVLRLANTDANIHIYINNSKFATTQSFFGVLFNICKVKEIEVSVVHTGPEELGKYYILHVKKSNTKPNNKKWSFGLIVDGKNVEFLSQFISSVEREFPEGEKDNVELIINGPSNNEYEIAFRDSYLNIISINTGSEFNHLGWITQKKNAIVKAAKNPNIALFHNRYKLMDGWLDAFDSFGYDFDLISLKQCYKGERFPDWVAAGNSWTLAKSILLDTNDFHPNLYVNGGAIVAKKEVLLNYPLNELLFWNEAEDIEHTKRLLEAGYMPRYAFLPSVDVLSMRDGFMNGFSYQNSLALFVFGYVNRLSHFSPIYQLLRSKSGKIKNILRNFFTLFKIR